MHRSFLWIVKDCRIACVGEAVLLVLTALRVLAAEPLPSASDITGRMVERAQKKAEQSESYTYEKRTLVEELDTQEKVVKSTVKIHQVKLIAGLPFSRLVQIQGRQLTPDELERENQREEAFRKKVTAVDMKKLAERKEAWLTPQLMSKFDFVVRDRVVLQGRPTLLLEFAPKAGMTGAGSIQDKMLSRVAGSIWVDEADAETARFAFKLQSPISLGWFGMLGSLNQFEMKAEQLRMPDGTWVNQKLMVWLSGRRLFSPMRMRTTEESSVFATQENSH